MNDITGRTAVVVGAGRGLGRGISARSPRQMLR